MQGVVKFINEKPYNGKMLYSFKLANDDALYMCGGDKPNISRGDFITFESKANPRGQHVVNLNSIQVKQSEVVEASTTRVSGTAGGKETYWDNKAKSDDQRQSKIEWQAARNSAIAAADLVLKHGGLKMPAKESAKYDVILALVTDLTNTFYEETKTLGAKPKAPALELEADVAAADSSEEGVDWDA
jgi:hypothetical protein